MTDETVFSEVPEEMAVKWFEQGAERLHVIDLDGAVCGKPVNRESIRKIARAIPIPIQLGGGLRDLDHLEAYLDLGIGYLILGTVATKDPDLVMSACEKFPDRIIIAIDAREDRVAVEGWTEELNLAPVELAKRYEEVSVSAINYTDIYRDGMRTGPNVEATRNFARAISIPVIISGGISGISDVMNIMSLEGDGVIGMITGRAIYDGSLNLREGIAVCRGEGEKGKS